MNRTTPYNPLRLPLRMWLLASLIALFSACGNLYTGDENLILPNDPSQGGNNGEGGGGGTAIDNKIPVMVAFSDPLYNVLTNDEAPPASEERSVPLSRAGGVIDPDGDKEAFHTRMGNTNFFVYAFRNDRPGNMDYGHYRVEDELRRFCLLDGSSDNFTEEQLLQLGLTAEEAKKHGKWARYNGNGSFVNWRILDDIPYYSVQQQLDPFQFFAYSFGDAIAGPVQRVNDRIHFSVEIDGSQDLMCASAIDLGDLVDDIESGKTVAPEFEILAKRMAELDADQLKTVKSYHYSTYSARFNLWPIIRLEHQLAYVKLNFYPALKNTNDVLYINSVTARIPAQGTFTVAGEKGVTLGAEFPIPDDPKQLTEIPLYNNDGEALTWYNPDATPEENFHAKIYMSEEALAEPDPYKRTPIAGGMFLAPQGNYFQIAIETVYMPDGDPQRAHTSTTVHDLRGEAIVNKDKDGNIIGYGLMKGRTYTISAAVYGPQEIVLTTVPTAWVNGGDINLEN